MNEVTKRKKRERHRRYERLRAGKVIVHGRMSSYNNWGCRCGPCTNAYMEWYTVHAAERLPPYRQLPSVRQQLADTQSDEIASLIQEQYNDEKAIRIGYARRLPRFDSDSAEPL